MQSKRRSSDLTRIIDYSAYERQRFVKYGLNLNSFAETGVATIKTGLDISIGEKTDLKGDIDETI